MGKAYKCDRCGKLYEKYRGPKINQYDWNYNGMRFYTSGSSSEPYDLCKECLIGLFEYMKIEPIFEEEKEGEEKNN